MSGSISFNVRDILAYAPALRETALPSEAEREKASQLDRYYDSICACIDQLEHPPFYVRWRRENTVNDVFFNILAGDLLLGEACLRQKNEPVDSWKWGALERLSYKLVDVYQKLHKGKRPPASPQRAFPAEPPHPEPQQVSSGSAQIMPVPLPLSNQPSAIVEVPKIKERHVEILKETSPQITQSRSEQAEKPEPGYSEKKASEVNEREREKRASSPAKEVIEQPIAPPPLQSSPLFPPETLDAASPLTPEETDHDLEFSGSEEGTPSQESLQLSDSDEILSDSSSLSAPKNLQNFVDFSRVDPLWKRFNRRRIHTKAQFFSLLVNHRKNATDHVAQNCFSEKERLASLWALKESLLKRSTVWRRPTTRDRHLLQVQEMVEKLSSFEKCELLRHSIRFVSGARGAKVIELLKKVFLESYVRSDEGEKELLRDYIEADDRLALLLSSDMSSIL